MSGRKIRNPKTGRLVLANGPIGKKILASRRKRSTKKRSTKKRSTPSRPLRKYASCCADCARKAKITRRRRPIYTDSDSDSDSDYIESDSDYDSDDYLAITDVL